MELLGRIDLLTNAQPFDADSHCVVRNQRRLSVPTLYEDDAADVHPCYHILTRNTSLAFAGWVHWLAALDKRNILSQRIRGSCHRRRRIGRKSLQVGG